MLHRRTTSSAPGGNASTSGSSLPASVNVNKAYTPLRRPSQTLYNTPQSSSSKARYTLPSPSPGGLGASAGLYVNTSGQGGGTGYFPTTRNSIDLGDEPLPFRSEDWARHVRIGMERMKMGIRDGLKLDRSLGLVWGDRELRTLVLKSSLINLLSLLLLSLSPLVLSPIAAANPSAQSRTKEISMWYNLLLSWPVFATCFWINASWSPDISRRAQTLLHPSYRHQPSPSSTPASSSFTHSHQSPVPWLMKALARMVLIIDFTFVSKVIGLVPLVGRPLAMGYMCIIDSYYFFDWTFTSRGMSLDRRVEFLQDRLAYMVGFGLPVTFITSFGPPLVSMAIFALLYPIFVIQAIQSKPPSAKPSLLPSTPSPSSPSTNPSSSTQDLDPFFSSSTPSRDFAKWDISKLEFKLPIFFFARYVIEGLGWFEAAVLRDRGMGGGLSGGGGEARRWQGQERAGKRMG